MLVGDMTTWFTADLHLGHGNIIGYCDRPWPDVAAMNAALVERWNDTVSPDDIVWVLGDLAMGSIDDSLALVAALPGRKLLLAGNHDRCWAGHGNRAEPWVARYLDAGFAEIHQGELHLDVGGHRVLACHFPYRGDSHDHDRYVNARPVDRGEWLLHGHVHERWRHDGRMLNVGVDVWDFRPVSEAQLAGLIEAGPVPRTAPPRT
jgi:calcineurin-like phosphoesterase family protein